MKPLVRLIPTICVIASCVPFAGCGSGGGGSTVTRTGQISGRIADLAQSRAVGTVTVTLDDSMVSVPAGADGKFTLSNVSVGLHTLVARSFSKAAAIVAEVSEGEQTDVGDVGLKDAGQISGLVASAATHAPLPDSHVTVTEMVADNSATILPHPVRGAHTDGSGSYTITGIPVGQYLVNVSHDGYDSISLSIFVVAGSTSPGDAALTPAAPASKGSMTGTVSLIADDGTQHPLAAALVRLAHKTDPQPLKPLPANIVQMAQGGQPVLFPTDRHDRELCTFTDDNGAYTLQGVPAGDYVAVAVRPGLEPNQKPVTIPAEGSVTVDFALHLRKPRVGIVQGVVTDSGTGKPIKGAQVGVILGIEPSPPQTGDNRKPASAEDGTSFITPIGFVLRTETDDTGHYQLRAPAGTRTIRAFAAGYDHKDSAVNVLAGGNVTADFSLVSNAGKQAILSGHVYRKNGDNKTPAPGANVTAVPEGDLHPGIAAQFSAKTNELGEYSLTLPAGNYTIRASTDNAISDATTIPVTHDTTADIVLTRIVGPPPGPPA